MRSGERYEEGRSRKTTSTGTRSFGGFEEMNRLKISRKCTVEFEVKETRQKGRQGVIKARR